MDYYKVLNVEKNATESQIKKAYRVLAKRYHPDTCSGDKKFAENKMREINEAYDTLSNKELKEKYDQSIGAYKEVGPQNYSANTNTYDRKYTNYNVRYKPNNLNVYYNDYGYAETNYGNYSEEEYKEYKISKKETAIKLIFILVIAVITVVGLINLFIQSIIDIKRTANDVSNTSKNNAILEENNQKLNDSFKQLKDVVSSAKETNNEDITNSESVIKQDENKQEEITYEELVEALKELGFNEEEIKEKFYKLLEAVQEYNSNH